MHIKRLQRILLSILLIICMGITGCGASSKEQDGKNKGNKKDENVLDEENLSDVGTSDNINEDEPFYIDDILGIYLDTKDILGVQYDLYESGLAEVTDVNKEFAKIQEEIEVDGVKYQVVALSGIYDEWTQFEIPSSIKYILERAFEHTQLQSLEIPNTVEYISGAETFIGSAIESISFPEDIKTDKEFSMFPHCENLKNIIIPDGVEVIDNLSNSGFLSVTIPNSVHTIEKGAFNECEELLEIMIPESVTTIESNAFGGCTSLKTLRIPGSVHTLALNMVNNTAIEEFIIPDTVTEYIDGEICEMPNLKTLKFSNSVNTVCEELDDCPNLKLIIFPDNIEDVDDFSLEGNGITIQVRKDVIDYFKQEFPNCNVVAKE